MAVSVPSNTSIVLLIGSVVPPGAAYGVLTQVEASTSILNTIGNPAYTSDDDDTNTSSPNADDYDNMLNYTIRTDFIAQNQVLYAMQWMTGYPGTVLLAGWGSTEQSSLLLKGESVSHT